MLLRCKIKSTVLAFHCFRDCGVWKSLGVAALARISQGSNSWPIELLTADNTSSLQDPGLLLLRIRSSGRPASV